MIIFILLLLLFRVSLCIQHRIRCHPPSPPPAPRPEDCRFLLAHLPSNTNPTDVPITSSFSSSLPFQPRAHLFHATCAAEFHYFMYDHSDAHLKNLQEAPPILEVFSAMKDAGESVVSRCLEWGYWRGGTALGRSDGLGWEISIEARLTDTWWEGIVAIWRRSMTGMMERMPPLPDAWGFGVWEV